MAIKKPNPNEPPQAPPQELQSQNNPLALAQPPPQTQPVNTSGNVNLTAEQLGNLTNNIQNPNPQTNPNASITANGQPQQPSNETKIFKDPKTGINTGIMLPDGRTFFGLSPEAINQIAAHELAKRAIPNGAVDFQAQGQQQLALEQGGQLAQQVNQPVALSAADAAQAQPAPLDIGQAARAAIGTAGISAAAGAVTGGLLGGGAASSITAPVGAALGAAGGLIAGFRNDLKSQRNGEISALASNLNEHEVILRKIIRAANADPSHAQEYLQNFNYQLALIERDHSKLKQSTDGDLDKFLNDGTRELAQYRTFYDVGGSKDYLVGQMQLALANPDPSKALLGIEDFQS